jgi:hypothetical protein
MCFANDPIPSKLKTESTGRRERRPVSLRGHVTREDGSIHEVLVLDLSCEGCGIHTPVDLEAGEKIELALLRHGAIDAEVRWCRDGKAGLVFAPDPVPTKRFWLRKHKRIALNGEASMRRIGHHNFRVQVFDASPTGCKVELVEMPKIGDYLVLRFDGLEALEAEVCWIEGFTAGLRFSKAIHPAVFDLVVSRLNG